MKAIARHAASCVLSAGIVAATFSANAVAQSEPWSAMNPDLGTGAFTCLGGQDFACFGLQCGKGRGLEFSYLFAGGDVLDGTEVPVFVDGDRVETFEVVAIEPTSEWVVPFDATRHGSLINRLKTGRTASLRFGDTEPFIKMIPFSLRGSTEQIDRVLRACGGGEPAPSSGVAVIESATVVEPSVRLAAANPEAKLNRKQRTRVQKALNKRGFDTGRPDGAFGRNTRAAIRNYQTATGAAPTGTLTADQVDDLLGRKKGVETVSTERDRGLGRVSPDEDGALADAAPVPPRKIEVAAADQPQAGEKPATPARAGKPVKRVALVIGIDAYENLSSLNNPVRDSEAIARLLEKHEFEVMARYDIGFDAFEATLAAFARLSAGADEAIVYYAGHGMAVVLDGKLVNVVVPGDATVSCETREASRAIAMDQFMAATEHVPNRVFLFDACRNDPFEACSAGSVGSQGFGFRAVDAGGAGPAGDDGRGLGRVEDRQRKKALIAYSTDLGALASDGEPGAHSPFAEALLAEMDVSATVPFREVLDRASGKVASATSFFQVPWVVTLGGEPAICLDAETCSYREKLDADLALRQSRLLVAAADKAADAHHYRKAMALALEALPSDMSDPDRPYLASAERALHRAVFNSRPSRRFEDENGKSGRPVAVSSDRRTLAVDLGGEMIALFDVGTGRMTSKIRGATGRPDSLLFDPEGSRVMSTGDNGDVMIWDAETGALLASRPEVSDNGMLEFGYSIAWNGIDDAVVGVGSDWINRGDMDEDRTEFLWLWNPKVGSYRRLPLDLGERVTFSHLAMHPTRPLAAVAYRDWANERTAYSVALLDLPEGRVVANFDPHADSITELRFSADGSLLLTASGDDTAKVWETGSGGPVVSLVGHSDTYLGISTARFSPNGEKVLTAGHDGTARLWDLETGIADRILDGGEETIWDAVFSPDGGLVATFDNNGAVNVWDAANPFFDAPVTNIAFEMPELGKRHYATIGAITFSPGGEEVITSLNGASAYVAAPANPEIDVDIGNRDVSAANFTKDGQLIVAGRGDLDVLDAVTGAEVSRIVSVNSGYLRGATSFLTPDGNYAVTPDRETLKVSDTRLGVLERTISLGDLYAQLTVVSRNGEMAAVYATDGSPNATPETAFAVLIVDLGTGNILFRLSGHTGRVVGIGFSPGDRYLASTSQDGTTRIWSVDSGALVSEIPATANSLSNNGFSPDGLLVATTSGGLKLWEVETGELVAEYNADGQNPEFSPDGQRIVLTRQIAVSAGWDGRIDVIDLTAGEMIASLDDDGLPQNASFDPTGRRILTGDFDGHVRVWRIHADTQELIDRACAAGPIPPAREERLFLGLDPEPSKTICETVTVTAGGN